MDRLLQHYLDGDLTPDQAAALEDRLAHEPDLEAELRSWEDAMAGFAAPARAAVSPGFTERVMTAVRAVEPISQDPTTHRRRARLRAPRLALAASLVFCFIAGYLAAGRAGNPGAPPALGPEGAFVAEARGGAGLRLVRLVHVGDVGARSVTVAGDFNAWRPDVQPLVHRDGYWTIDLALPPGLYEYMFVVDGQRWVTDPLARVTRDDGYGGSNAVLDLTL